MAFEKMTERELFDKFWSLYGLALGSVPIKTRNKIGARMLRIELETGLVLYFLYYDETNWNLGTKPYRNRPKKQIYSQVRKDLKDGDSLIDAFKKIYRVNDPKDEFGGVSLEEAIQEMKIAEAKGFNEGFRELKTKSNEAITGCNQWENIEREAEAMANQPLEPIDWVKEDPEVVMDSYPPSAE